MAYSDLYSFLDTARRLPVPGDDETDTGARAKVAQLPPPTDDQIHTMVKSAADVPATTAAPMRPPAYREIGDTQRPILSATAPTTARIPDEAPAMPTPMRLAGESPSYSRYQQAQASLPSEQDYITSHRPQSVLGRIGEAAKLGGRMFLQSGFNPMVGAAGLALGGLDKDAYARDVYRTSVQPRAHQEEARLLTAAHGEIGLRSAILDRDLREEQIRSMSQGRQLTAAQHQEQLDETARAHLSQEQERRFHDRAALFPDRPFTKEEAAYYGRPELEGVAPKHVTPKQHNTYTHYEKGQDGILYGITAEGDAQPVMAGDRPLRTYEKPESTGESEIVTTKDPDPKSMADWQQRRNEKYAEVMKRPGAALDPSMVHEEMSEWDKTNPRPEGPRVTTRRKTGGRAGGDSGTRHPSISAAKAQYQAYIKAHPENRQRAREKFKSQNNGVDPEAQ